MAAPQRSDSATCVTPMLAGERWSLDTRFSDATLADVLLAGMVLLAFGA